MTNTFTTYHLLAIQEMINEKATAKRSVYYSRAICIGKPDLPGCLLVSQEEEEDSQGRFPWLVHYFPCHHPKEVADGEINLLCGFEDKFDTWRELQVFIKKMVDSSFSKEGYLKM